MPHYRGPFASEIVFVPGDPLTEDCVAASGLDIAAAAGIGNPVNRLEREALRVDSGDTSGGQSLESLARGLDKRYGHRPHSSTTWQYVVDHPERWFVCIGQYKALSPHLRRWQLSGSFLHAVAFGPATATERWWANPLAPPSYGGEPVSLAQIRKYMATGADAAVSFAENEFSITGGGDQPVVGFSVLDGPSGTVSVKGAGHWYMTLDDGKMHGPINPTNFPPRLGHPVHLNAPIPGGSGDRQTGWLVGGQAAFLLATDVSVDFGPVPDDRYDQGRRDEWDTWNALFPERP